MLLSRCLYLQKNKSVYVYPIVLQQIQKRRCSYPVMMCGGCINFFAITQLWNPYFPREKIITLMNVGNGIFFLGMIL
jgi:hypothetical protein